jgi:transposase
MIGKKGKIGDVSNEELLKAYKDQQKVERGFRFLKDPMFMASTFFLKSRKRIMALMMVMTLCLLVYAALEHRIREALDINNETLPNQKGKPVSSPTARWVFQFFFRNSPLGYRKYATSSLEFE